MFSGYSPRSFCRVCPKGHPSASPRALRVARAFPGAKAPRPPTTLIGGGDHIPEIMIII